MAPNPFASWTLDDVKEAIDTEVERNALLFSQGRVGQAQSLGTYQLDPIEVNRAFVEGNHWQGGDGWIGPHPQPGDTGFDETMLEIETGFTSRNAIGEIVQRHASGLVGREPRWSLTVRRALEEGEAAAPEEQTLIDEAEALLTEWWDARKLHSNIQTSAARLVYAERSALRLYVPAGLLEEGAAGGRVIRARSMEDALALVHLDLPEHDQAMIVTDPDTQMIAGLVLYEVGRDAKGEGEPEEVAEIVYVDAETKQTIIRLVSDDDGDGSQGNTFSFNLGKRLTTYEMRRRLLITRQVQQIQKALNLALSMLPRNVVTGGFLERVLLNAQMPGEWTTDKDGNPERFIPAPFPVGAGTTQFVRGIDYKDEQGRTVITTPSIQWRDPVDPKSAIAAAEQHYTDMLDECDQAHILQANNAGVGWRSREVARADYLSSLLLSASEVEPAGRWLLETALAMAEQFIGTPGRYTSKLRAVFQCRLDTGPITAQERTAIDGSVAAGTLSRNTGMLLNGVEDPDAEIAAIQAQPGGDISLIKQQVPLVASLATVAGVAGAARAVGMTEEQVDALESSMADVNQDTTDPTDTGDQPESGGNGAAPPNDGAGAGGSANGSANGKSNGKARLPSGGRPSISSGAGNSSGA